MPDNHMMPPIKKPSKRSYFWRTVLKVGANYDKPLTVLRKNMVKVTNFLKMPKGVTVSVGKIAKVPVEHYQPAEITHKNKLMLYLHGGGYVMGSVETHRSLVARLAKSCGLPALSLDYRLAPEYPFPAAIDDVLAVYNALINKSGVLPPNFAPSDIIIAGDSAGAGLALATLISLRDQEIALPAMAFCISPWTDLALTGDSLTSHADIDPYIYTHLLSVGAKLYIAENNSKHPLISPLYADLSGLPPLLIHVGTDEVLLSDSTRLADLAKAAGVEVEIKIWNKMWHDFHMWSPYVPEATKAIEEVALFVKRQWHS